MMFLCQTKGNTFGCLVIAKESIKDKNNSNEFADNILGADSDKKEDLANIIKEANGLSQYLFDKDTRIKLKSDNARAKAVVEHIEVRIRNGFKKLENNTSHKNNIHLYVVVNEMNTKNFYTRKVYKIFNDAESIFKPLGLSSYEIMQQMFPNEYGLAPTNLKAQNSISEHIIEKTKHLSRFISVSELQEGAKYSGNLVFIDKNELARLKVKTYSTQEIIDIINKTENLTDSEKQKLKKIVFRDKEILLAPKEVIPKQVIITENKMNISKIMTTAGKSIQVAGIFMTFYDLEQATERSIEQNSLKPIMAEATRQIGGWTGALSGAKIGAGVGLAFGLGGGPCAILTTLGGAVIFGILGYNAGSLIGDKIEK